MDKRYFQPLILLCMTLLFLFPAACILGARNGLLLWARTLVPTLLPFMILTGLMTRYDTTSCLSWLCFPIYKKYHHLNRDLPAVFLFGFLCGYPLGAKVISDLMKSGSLTGREAQLLLTVCNNLSPMFTLGFTLTITLKGTCPPALFFFCMYLPNLIFLLGVLIFSRNQGLFSAHKKNTWIKHTGGGGIIATSLSSVMSIGVYVMICSMAASLLLSLPAIRSFAPVLVAPLEVTNGISCLSAMPMSQTTKTAAITAASSFGGLCGIAQSATVCRGLHLSMKKYAFSKACFGLGSFALMYLMYGFVRLH